MYSAYKGLQFRTYGMLLDISHTWYKEHSAIIATLSFVRGVYTTKTTAVVVYCTVLYCTVLYCTLCISING